jgi:2-dehydro-3-deoxygluconokinase
MNKRVLTFGEPMGLFIAEEEAPVEDVKHYTMSLAGAEFNVAVGLTRLGYQVGYLTKLGHDPFGKAIEAGMRHVGIDTSMTIYSEDHQTGFMLKSKTEKGDPDTFYFRKNSAASTISDAGCGKD